MAVGLPSLNTKLSPEPLWCAVYANSNPPNLAESATRISRKIRARGRRIRDRPHVEPSDRGV